MDGQNNKLRSFLMTVGIMCIMCVYTYRYISMAMLMSHTCTHTCTHTYIAIYKQINTHSYMFAHKL